MYLNLRTLCGLYVQDFDLIFQQPTDPIDMFCKQNSPQAQNELLREMVDFYQRAQTGERSIKDLIKMGLGYSPSGRDSLEWFPEAIEYLRAKAQN